MKASPPLTCHPTPQLVTGFPELLLAFVRFIDLFLWHCGGVKRVVDVDVHTSFRLLLRGNETLLTVCDHVSGLRKLGNSDIEFLTVSAIGVDAVVAKAMQIDNCNPTAVAVVTVSTSPSLKVCVS